MEKYRILEEVDGKRRQYLFHFVAYIFMASFFGVVGLVLFILSFILGPISFFWPMTVGGAVFLYVGMPILTVMATTCHRDYRNYFALQFFGEATEAIYENAFVLDRANAREASRINQPFVNLSLTSNGIPFEGTREGISFLSYPYEVQSYVRKRKTSFEKRDTRHPFDFSPKQRPRAAGRYYRFTLPEEKSSSLMLWSKKDGKRFRHKKNEWEPLKPEYSRFAEIFEVKYQGERLEAVEFISPNLLGELTRIAEDFNGGISLYLDKDTVHVILNRYEPKYRLGFSRPAENRDIDAFKEEMEIPKRIIDALLG